MAWMNKRLFEWLAESMAQHTEIVCGDRAGARQFRIDGPAKALLRTIRNDPKAVLKALAG
jgi:hypothetical protein